MEALAPAFILGIIGLALYFIPTMIAVGQDHRQCVAIFMLNLLLGWTLLGWAGAIIWACMKPAAPVTTATF